MVEGRGALVVKADIKEAYRMVPVHPEDQPLLGILWNNKVYIDKMLPFGLRSAPIIFSVVADALQWILIKHGIPKLLHYLDDFILIAMQVTIDSGYTKTDINLNLGNSRSPSRALKTGGSHNSS